MSPKDLIDNVVGTAFALTEAHREFLEAEIGHRRERREAEHRVREAQPSAKSAAVDFLVERDPQYQKALARWVEAQVARTSATGVHEVAKLRAWSAVRQISA